MENPGLESVTQRFHFVNAHLLFHISGLAFLVVSLGIAAWVGSIPIPISAVWDIAISKTLSTPVDATWPKGFEAVVWEIRLPRSILACLVGAGLALVGVALQSVTRSQLADPHLLGVSSGGAFGAILALLHTGLWLGPFTVPLTAFMGSLGATLVVLGVSRFAGATSAARLVLTGVAVSFVIMACANILIFLGDPGPPIP